VRTSGGASNRLYARRRPRWRRGVAVLGWATVVATSLILTPEDGRATLAAVLSLTTLAVWPLISQDVVSPGSALAVVLLWFFAVAPAVQLSSGRFSIYHLADPHESFIYAAMMAAAYAVSFALGLKLVGMSRPADRPRHHYSGVRARRVIVLGLVLGAIGWVAYLSALGGVAEYLRAMQNRTQMSAGLGYLFWMANIFQLAAAVAFVSSVSGARTIPRVTASALVLIAALLILLLGLRSRAVMYIAAVMLASFLAGARLRPARIVPLIAMGAAVIFLAGRVRMLGSGSGAIFDRDLIKTAMTATASEVLESTVADYGHFDRLSMIWEYFPSRQPYQYGTTLIAVFAIPVPRGWYADKPVGAGPLLANTFRPGAWDLEAGWASGQTPTIMGELYLNLSWPGVMAGGLIGGIVAAWAYRRWRVNGATYWDSLQYSVFVIYMLGAGTLGEFYGSVIVYMIFALPLACGAWYCSDGAQRSNSVASTMDANAGRRV